MVLLRAGNGPIRDVDYYWHLIVGQEILSGTPVTEAAQGWSIAPVPDTWVTTQWLAEVVFGGLESWFGLSSALVFRIVTAALILATLAWATLRGRPLRSGAWVFAIVSVQVAIVTQERSQQITYILAPLLGLWALRIWRDGRLPAWWLLLPTVWIWSQFHGGWVLAPALLLLAAGARLLDQRSVDRAVTGAALLAAGSVVVALLTPAGTETITAARRFAAATGSTIEWQPVELWAWSSLPLAVLLLLIIVCWARGAQRPSVSELLVVLTLGALALSAYRNVAPAMLALAATAVTILARTLGEPDPPTEPQSSPAVRRGAWALTGAAGAVAVALALTTPSPVDPEMVPSRLLDRVADAGGQRMLTTYNVSGPLLWFGGPPPGVLVSVDGRADRYGADYLSRYAEMEAGAPGWEDLVDELRPTAALLREDRALAELLMTRRGWIEVDRQGDYILLRAPGAQGWASAQPAT